MLYAATLLDTMSMTKVSQEHVKRTLGGPHKILQPGGLIEKWTLDLRGQGAPFP